MTGRLRMTVVAAVATFLSTLSLWSLLHTERWPYLALVVIALMAATGWAGRRLRVPTLLALLASLAVLGVFVTFVFAREDAILGLVPTPQTFHDLQRLALDGLVDVRRFSTPAPERKGIMFFTIGGIGLVALLVDLFAVRFRRPAVAGLPMLALFSVSAGILQDGPGWLPFLLSALGFLGLLLADGRERLARWGRPVLVRRPWDRRDRAPRTETADTAPIASLGRRIGFTAIVIAVLLPALIPMTDQSFAGGTNTSRSIWLSRFGAPTLRAPDPIVSMRRDLVQQSDRPFLRYTSTTDHPDYLRTAVLTQFDGESWRTGRLRGFVQNAVNRDVTLTTPTGTDISQLLTVRTRVTVVGGVDLSFLPAPYAPQQIDAEGSWYYEPGTLTLFSPSGVRTGTGGLSYVVDSQVPRPRPTALQVSGEASSLRQSDLALPADLPTAVREQARTVTATKKTRYEKAVALQEWFTRTGGFTYTTDVPSGNGTNAIMQFLTDRRGYCEQYASAMAVMARSIGIPARVAVGFTQGDKDGRGWVVRGRDAHAWPELWFEGVGWVRFEPTPSGAAGQGSAEEPGYSRTNALTRDPRGDQETDPTSLDGSSGASDSAASSSFRERNLSQSSVGAAAGGGGGGGISGRVVATILVVLLVVLLLLLVPAAGRRLTARRRWARARDPAALAHAAWAELRDHLRDLGVPARPGDTPRSTAAALAKRLGADPAATEAVRRIALAEERARYAERPDTPASVRGDVRTVRAAVAASVPRADRWRARWLPRSVLHRARTAFARLGSRYDDLDVATGRYVGRLVPRRFRTGRT